VHVLREDTEPDQAGGDRLQDRVAAQRPQDQGWLGREAAGQQGGEEAVLDGALSPLDEHGRQHAAKLDPRQVPARQGSVPQGPGEEVGGGDGVVDGQVDADPTDGGHGMGGVADAQ
jgi:hypothetical protein